MVECYPTDWTGTTFIGWETPTTCGDAYPAGEEEDTEPPPPADEPDPVPECWPAPPTRHRARAVNPIGRGPPVGESLNTRQGGRAHAWSLPCRSLGFFACGRRRTNWKPCTWGTITA